MGRLFVLAGATIVSQIYRYTTGITRHNPSEETTPPLYHFDEPNAVVAQGNDFITALPGLHFDPGFRQYAGYLTVDKKNKRRIFYWYFESQKDPTTDPVVLWTNGGPGCSGLIGMGTEHGPFFIDRDGDLTMNPYSWNTIANMLYIEQPAGVGFSYSKTLSDYRTGDDQAASDMYEVIREFLIRFPERQSNRFYIASESYGGHYMPHRKFVYRHRVVTNRIRRFPHHYFTQKHSVAMEILNRNTDGFINFNGMMVGNPYVDPYTNTMSQFQSWYFHGLLPYPLYQTWMDHCQNPDQYLSLVRTRRDGSWKEKNASMVHIIFVSCLWFGFSSNFI